MNFLLGVSLILWIAKPRTGAICATRGLRSVVIPAKAGIHSVSHWKFGADALDSRLRGNDVCFERDPIPNDTRTRTRSFLFSQQEFADVRLFTFALCLLIFFCGAARMAVPIIVCVF
jgi:hypothetical protein